MVFSFQMSAHTSSCNNFPAFTFDFIFLFFIILFKVFRIIFTVFFVIFFEVFWVLFSILIVFYLKGLYCLLCIAFCILSVGCLYIAVFHNPVNAPFYLPSTPPLFLMVFVCSIPALFLICSVALSFVVLQHHYKGMFQFLQCKNVQLPSQSF